jgi:tetratricopeptide (TPR) repeat protein
MFQTITFNVLFTYAENEYAQVLEEVGITGFIILAVFCFFVCRSYYHNIHNKNSHINFAAYGLGFGLLAIIIHSLSDFGQHLPSNAFLSVIFCGLLISIANKPQQQIGSVTINKNYRLFALILLFLTCGIFVWSFIGVNNARKAESNWSKAVEIEDGLIKKDWNGTDDEFKDLIAYVGRASECEPLNVKYVYWYNVYRWYSIIKTTEPDPIDGSIIGEDSLDFTKDIVDGLNRAILLCPTYGPAYSLSGRIEMYIFGDEKGSDKIRLGYQLAPCDAIACIEAGRLNVIEGNLEESYGKFNKAVTIDPGLFKDVVDIYIYYLSRPDLAIEAAGEDFQRLQHVKSVLDEMQYNDLVEQICYKQQMILEKLCSLPSAGAGDYEYLADIYRIQGDYEKAIHYYRQVLNVDYGRVRCRYELAKLLSETKQVTEAMRQARICIRLRPHHDPAKELIKELSVNPAGFSNNTN